MECEKYKMFLEKITPAEWKEEQFEPQLQSKGSEGQEALRCLYEEAKKGAKEEGASRKALSLTAVCRITCSFPVRWKKERLAPFMEYLAHEEQKLFEKFAQEDAEAAVTVSACRTHRTEQML